jgi:hypothetical protein
MLGSHCFSAKINCLAKHCSCHAMEHASRTSEMIHKLGSGVTGREQGCVSHATSWWGEPHGGMRQQQLRSHGDRKAVRSALVGALGEAHEQVQEEGGETWAMVPGPRSAVPPRIDSLSDTSDGVAVSCSQDGVRGVVDGGGW